MTLGADLNTDLFCGRPGFERIAACACHDCFCIFRMNVFLHFEYSFMGSYYSKKLPMSLLGLMDFYGLLLTLG